MKKILVFTVLILSLVVLIGCQGEEGTPKDVKTIVVDAGGDIGNFNTTPLMTPSDANPFPYNTLETLAREWEVLNPGYKIQINSTSSNGDRSILVPQLNNKTAPDIVYQNGVVANMDLGKDYYVQLNDYLKLPNPYVDGNQKWEDIYVMEELAQTMASDGKHYYVTLEKIPVGIIYNRDIFTEAGILEIPETYSQLLDAMEKIKTQTDKEAYSTTYTWYDIALETALYSSMLAEADVLTVNGKIDTEEFVRAFELGIWNPTLNALGANATFENNKYLEYINITKMKTAFYPENWQSYDAHTNFANGNIAMVEVTGREIRRLSINKNIDFDWAVMPFPDLTVETSPNASNNSVRGVAGLATPWYITNSAVEKDTVEGAIDFLMFLTAPENNNRLIGDLKGGIPLNPDENTEIAEYLEDLLTIYNADVLAANSGNRVYWGAVNSWAMLGYAYNTAFIKNLQDIDNGIKTVEEATASLAQTIRNTVMALKIENDYDESLWQVD